MSADIVHFVPLSGEALVDDARQARAVPEGRRRSPSQTSSPMERMGMIDQALAIIAAGRTADGPITMSDAQDLARLARSAMAAILADLNPVGRSAR